MQKRTTISLSGSLHSAIEKIQIEIVVRTKPEVLAYLFELHEANKNIEKWDYPEQTNSVNSPTKPNEFTEFTYPEQTNSVNSHTKPKTVSGSTSSSRGDFSISADTGVNSVNTYPKQTNSVNSHTKPNEFTVNTYPEKTPYRLEKLMDRVKEDMTFKNMWGNRAEVSDVILELEEVAGDFVSDEYVALHDKLVDIMNSFPRVEI
jgi:hypothetical protein